MFRFSRFWPRLRIRRIHRPLRTTCSIRRVPLLHLEVLLNPQCTHQLQQQPGQTLPTPTAFGPACTTTFHQFSKSEIDEIVLQRKEMQCRYQDVAILSLHRVYLLQSCECNSWVMRMNGHICQHDLQELIITPWQQLQSWLSTAERPWWTVFRVDYFAGGNFTKFQLPNCLLK